MALEISQPHLPNLIRRFLYDQLYSGDDVLDNDPPLHDCPVFSGKVSVYQNARAIFYAPSELAGPGGMHSEVIRANPSWYGERPRFDTVLVQNEEDRDGMAGMLVGRVLRFIAFTHDDVRYTCALVEWFVHISNAPDPLTGMWIVEPEFINGQRSVGLIHTECIVRACHFIPVFGRTHLPINFHFSRSLDVFRRYYVNCYADYHSHENIY